MKKRIFVSARETDKLDDRRSRLKTAVISKIRDHGFEPQLFSESGLPATLVWNFENVDKVMRQCVGAVVLGFPFRATSLVGENNQYEGAVAITLGLPVLLFKEEGVEGRGIVWNGGGKRVIDLPKDADDSWVRSEKFTQIFNAWTSELDSRKVVFLGYCSKSADVAARIQLIIERAGASVLNWAMDFRAGGSILNEIKKACETCSCGVFIFSEDDFLEGTYEVAAPRDNVIFEAGYFMSSKGPERCLIVRLGEAKMPADIGGNIYISLKKGDDASFIEGQLWRFISNNI